MYGSETRCWECLVPVGLKGVQGTGLFLRALPARHTHRADPHSWSLLLSRVEASSPVRFFLPAYHLGSARAAPQVALPRVTVRRGRFVGGARGRR